MNIATHSEKVEKVIAITGADAPTAEVYLELAEAKILARLYPFGGGDEIPEEHSMTHVELAARLFARRGGEGETSHSENGVSRQYATPSDEDILDRLVPHAKVVG